MRGKQIDNATIYKIMSLYAVNGNYCETARKLKLAESTVRKIVKENKDKPEFAKLCEEKRKDFDKAASELIDLALVRVKRLLTDDETDIPLNQLTTAIGTLYDKRALARGESTENQSVTIKLPEGMNEYAE